MSARSAIKGFLIAVAAVLLLSSCTGGGTSGSETAQNPSGVENKGGYMQITQQEAKNIMDTERDYALLDVRTEAEFSEGHIAGARLIPDDQILQRAERELPDKAQWILVYCRSGRRSKNAAEKLANLGYINVREFGGIIDWPYGTTN